MTLKVQNSYGSVASANAYITLAEFKSYHDDRGNDYSGFIDAKLENAIIKATDFLDTRFNFLGIKMTLGVKAAGTLTATSNFSPADTVTIGGVVYTFTASAVGENNIAIGGTLATSLSRLQLALSGTGDEGSDYGADTAANADVTSVADATTLVVTALLGGPDGNTIPTLASTSAASWGAVTLTGGTEQTTEFPRMAGSDAFVWFGAETLIGPVQDVNMLGTSIIALVAPDGQKILGIPTALKRACAEYTFRALSQPLFQDAPAPEGGRIIDEHTVKVDTIEEIFKYAPSQAGAFAMPAYPAADLLLARAGLISAGRVIMR